MKRTIVFSFLLVVLANSIFASTTKIDLTKDPDKPGPKPLSITYLPVSAAISETQLAVYFDAVVGLEIIKIYDTNNSIISLEMVDTSTTSEVFIATNAWTNGSYMLEISYGTTTLSGEFSIE